MFEKIKRWNHRQMVKSAAASMKHWKWEVYWPLTLISIMLFVGALYLFLGSYAGLVFIGVGSVFYIAYGKKMIKVRRMTEQERLQFFAKWNRVNPEEVSTFIEAKKSLKVS